MLIFRVIFMMFFKQWQSFHQEKCDTYNVTTYTLDDSHLLKPKSWRWMIQLICLFKQVFFSGSRRLIFQCPCWPSSFLLPQSLATCCQVDVNGQVSVEAIDSGSGKSVLVLKKVDLGTQGIFWRETNSSPEQVYSWKDVHFPSHHFWYLYIKLNFGVVGCCRFWFQILFYV